MSALSRTVLVTNRRGLHARASAKFVNTVHDLPCHVEVEKDGNKVTGTSIMGLMMLGAAMVNLVAFWRFLHPEVFSGQMFVLIVMTVMALEMAVGFGVATARFRARGSVEMEEARDLSR